MRYASEKPDSFFKLDISESDWANSIERITFFNDLRKGADESFEISLLNAFISIFS
jgi:hypothetical protein